MVETRKYLIGADVVASAGELVIKEIQDSDNEINEIFFDRKDIPVDFAGDHNIKSFMRYAQSEGERDAGSGAYKINNVIVHLSKPEKLDNIFGMTEDPEIQEEFYAKGVKKVEPPEFLLQDPRLLNNGLIKRKTNKCESDLENKISMDKGVEMFEIDNPFINQFVHLELCDGKEAVFKLKQNVELKPDGCTYRHKGEPSWIRIASNQKKFPSKKRGEYDNLEKEHNLWGYQSNSLNQHLALTHLLLDPTIQLVVLSGGPGTGKTLLPYIAGLYQTLRTDKKAKSLYQAMYLCRPLVSASDEIGFLPGDVDEKLSPLYENFSGIHSMIDLHHDYSFDDALKKGNAMKVSQKGLHLPDERRPLIEMKNAGYMRGVNLPDGWILYDEFQNFDRKEAKLLLTRAASGSKTIICGDVGQIDNRVCSMQRNGLVFAAHHHMSIGHPHVGVMHLEFPERNIISNHSMNMPNYRS